MAPMPFFKGPEEIFMGLYFGGLAASNKAATTSLNKDKGLLGLTRLRRSSRALLLTRTLKTLTSLN